MRDSLNNIELYYKEQLSDIYYHWNWYNKRCEFCNDYLYGYYITYHCKKCNINYCKSCSYYLKKSDSDSNQKAIQSQSDNINHKIKQKIEDIGNILWSYPHDSYIPLHVRFTWPNILSYLCLFWEVFQLISVLLFIININTLFPNIFPSSSSIPTINEINNDPILLQLIRASKWFLLAHQNTNETLHNIISILLIICGFFWIIICSLPLVCEQLFNFVSKRGTFTQSSMWIKCTWFFTKILYVFFIINWIRLFQCIQNDDDDKCIIITSNTNSYNILSILSFIILIFYWLTAGIIVVYNTAQTIFKSEYNIDIIYPIVFIHILQLFQSLFIISGMLLILNDLNTALIFCLILSYLMLIWHLIYPLISSKLINNQSNNTIYSFSSIPNMIILRIFLYIILCYNVTILYIYLTDPDPSQTTIGGLILYGSIILFVIGFILSFLYHRYCIKKERDLLSKSSELRECLKLLISLYNKTDRDGIIGNWAKDESTILIKQIINENNDYNNIRASSTSSLFNVSDIANIIIDFERYILFERLTEEFLNNRKKWRNNLFDCVSFNDLIPFILQLVNAIQIPPFFTLGVNILKNETIFRNAPIVLCNVIMQYICDYQAISDLSAHHLININQIPSTVNTLDKWGKYFSITQSINRFSNQTETKLKTFINKTLIWHINKKEYIYGSYIKLRNQQHFDNTMYTDEFKRYYFILCSNYIICFNDKINNIKSLSDIPVDIIDIQSIVNLTDKGYTFINDRPVYNNNNNNNDNKQEEKEEKKENILKVKAEDELIERNPNIFYLFSLNKIRDNNNDKYYRYYWWYSKTQTKALAALNIDTYNSWIRFINRVLKDKAIKNKKSALWWSKDIKNKINNNNNNDDIDDNNENKIEIVDNDDNNGNKDDNDKDANDDDNDDNKIKTIDNEDNPWTNNDDNDANNTINNDSDFVD